jgi:hypothetical protein
MSWLLKYLRLSTSFYSKCVSYGGSHLAPNGFAYLLGGRKGADLVHYLIQLGFKQLGYAIKQLRSWLLLFLCRIYAVAFHLLLFALWLWACEIYPALYALHVALSCSAAASFWCLSLMCLAMLLEKTERLQ